MRDQTVLHAANAERSARAAAQSVTAVRAALAQLGADVPPRLADFARLRMTHPTATLTELGALADPPVSKDTVAGVLRRLLTAAAARAHAGQ